MGLRFIMKLLLVHLITIYELNGSFNFLETMQKKLTFKFKRILLYKFNINLIKRLKEMLLQLFTEPLN